MEMMRTCVKSDSDLTDLSWLCRLGAAGLPRSHAAAHASPVPPPASPLHAADTETMEALADLLRCAWLCISAPISCG